MTPILYFFKTAIMIELCHIKNEVCTLCIVVKLFHDGNIFAPDCLLVWVYNVFTFVAENVIHNNNNYDCINKLNVAIIFDNYV